MPEEAPVENDVIINLGVEETSKREICHNRAQVIFNAGKVNLNFRN